MKSTTALLRLTLRSLVCLTFVTLTACASPTLNSPPSSLVILKETSADAIAKVCEGLAPEMLTAEESADVLMLNYAARAGKRYLEICKQRET